MMDTSAVVLSGELLHSFEFSRAPALDTISFFSINYDVLRPVSEIFGLPLLLATWHGASLQFEHSPTCFEFCDENRMLNYFVRSSSRLTIKPI